MEIASLRGASKTREILIILPSTCSRIASKSKRQRNHQQRKYCCRSKARCVVRTVARKWTKRSYASRRYRQILFSTCPCKATHWHHYAEQQAKLIQPCQCDKKDKRPGQQGRQFELSKDSLRGNILPYSLQVGRPVLKRMMERWKMPVAGKFNERGVRSELVLS